MEHRLTTPLSKIDIEKLNAGDRVYLTGTIYTARDAAHERMTRNFSKGIDFPIKLDDAIIYYAGPCPAKPGEVIGSCGPTTAGRMDAYTPTLLDNGLKVMIGKGQRNDKVRNSVIKNGCVYLGATGGAGALIAECIKEATLVAYDDLGTEAIRKLSVENMPLVVLMDFKGNSAYDKN